MKRRNLVAVVGLFTALTAQGAVVELNCYMQPDMGDLLRSMPRETANAFKAEMAKRPELQVIYKLDTEKKSLLTRWRDVEKGGYQWRTFKNIQKRVLSDGVTAYVYEGDVKDGKEMIMVMPEVKTVIRNLTGLVHEGKPLDPPFVMTLQGACS